MTPATLRELAGEPPVLCTDCGEQRPMRGYDICRSCQIEFLRAHPDERAVYVPTTPEEHEILALVTDAEQRRRA